MAFLANSKPARKVMLLAVLLGIALPARAFESLSFATPGAPGTLREALIAASLTAAARRDGVTEPQDVMAAARADYARLVGVLYADGRYGGVISIRVDGREAAAVSPLNIPRDVREVVIRIEPGPVFRLGAAQIEPLAPGTELPPAFRRGNVAQSGPVRDAVSAALEGWRDVGHAKAGVAAQSLRADHRARELDVDVRLRPGPRLRFGRLLLDGPSAVREARIRKIAGLPEGEVFSPDELATVAERLRRTGAFRSVSLAEAAEANADGTLDIRARLSDAKPRRFGFGAEYSTLEGATLSAFWLHRNLLGGAERFRVDGELRGVGGETGGMDLGLGARYERPATPDPDTSFFTELSAERLDEPDYLSTQFGAALGFHRIYSRTLEAEMGLEWQHARIEDTAGTDEFDVLSLPTSLTWDRRDDALDATRGQYLRAELRPFTGTGATSSGLRAYADGRIYRPLSRRFVLAGRLQIGAVSGPAVADAPPDYLFYSGGGGTVRGQSYQSLGIDLPGGQRRGGRSFLGLSAEARMGLGGRLGLVAFADAGYVGAEAFPDGSSGEWHGGAGLGLRYDTGIGPIRLDVAAPVSGGSSGAQIYVGVGQAF